MKANVTMKDEYWNQEWLYVCKYNSYYDIFYRASSEKDTFEFILYDRDKSEADKKFFLMAYERGIFRFRQISHLFLPNIECIYPFIKKADIRINNIGLAHIINLKKNNLINGK